MHSFDNQAFDPLSSSFADDPYRVYKVLREAGEPLYFEENNMWLLSRYEDVSAVATNSKMLRSLEGFESKEDAETRQVSANWHEMPFHERVVQFSLLDSGHFVLFRRVWRDGERYVQGMLLEPQALVDNLIAPAFQESVLSTMSDLIAQLTLVSLGASVLGLIVAVFFYFRVKSLPEGTDTMNMIAR